MSLENGGRSCVVCNAYLFDEDDIVYCPECGAPHHRDCYLALGHCGLSQLHGTEQQYDKVLARNKVEKNLKDESEITSQANGTDASDRCIMCGEEYSSAFGRCPRCGAPHASRFGSNITSADLLGGVPADSDLGGGVTADEAKRFVFSNTQRYIPKFIAMKQGVKSSWNWMAFFFPGPWFLSRKMYVKGILVSALTIAFSLLQFPLIKAMSYVDLSSTGYDYYTALAQSLQGIQPIITAAAMAGAIAVLIVRLISGFSGDRIYYSHTVSSVKALKIEATDVDAEYRKKGGLSFWAMSLGYLAVTYLPGIIAQLAGL